MKGLAGLFSAQKRQVIGLMSGTSADGVDAALVEVERLKNKPGQPLAWSLVDFVFTPYGRAVREEILAVQEGGDQLLERITRLHAALGWLYADAVEKVAGDAGVPLDQIDLVACHGQTVCHFPRVRPATGPRGRDLFGSEAWGKREHGEWVSPATLQLGEPAFIAERTGVPVMHNFRSRDIAAGGTGAPLVPLVDHLLFGATEQPRLALNVGGIANVTHLLPGARAEDVTAFDTGPGNMVIDALVSLLTEGKRTLDEGGAWARKGNPDQDLVTELLEAPFFNQAPPRAAGRGEFGLEYAQEFLARGKDKKLSDAGILATATTLSARAVHHAAAKFLDFTQGEIIVSGGGAKNVAFLEALSAAFPGAKVVTSDYYGLDVDAKEAVAFALLAYLSLEGKAGNVPKVTGARHPVVLGSLTPGGRS